MRSTGEPHHICGRLSKLTLEQHLLSFILYMKHNNITKYYAFLWNWSKSAINDDRIFIASYINSTIANEIWWPTIEEHQVLAVQLHNSRAALDLLMVLLSKFVCLETIQPIGVGLMGERRCIA